ncbi:MAG: glycosyltransferase family 4 protein [Spirochaetia bacterium]|nr:glycosyltransferase family 4 protein [Spirochaetia bacterium]
MKIAFFIQSTSWGGLEMNTLNTAIFLKKKKQQVLLITNPKSRIYQEVKKTFYSTWLIGKTGKYFDFKNALKISKKLKAENIFTVFVIDNKDLDVIVLTKKFFYKKLNIIYQQQMQIAINKRDFLHTWRFGGINYWISPLEVLKKEVLQRTRFPEKRIVVIPLCVDINRFIKPKYSKKEARKKLGILPKAPLIGIIGRVSPKKGQFFLIKAVEALRKKGVLVDLLIFGSPSLNESGEYLRQMKQYVEDRGLESCIYFHEYASDVEMFYNAIDIFTLASESETFGMVTVEAMLSSLPVIATNSGGTPEILAYGKFGLLYEYNNIEDYAEKVQWTLAHKREVNHMAQEAGKNAAKYYSKDYEIEQILHLLKKLENGSRET